MKDLMIDIETLGTAASAPVLTIGACFFDIMTGEIGAKFHQKIDVVDALHFSRMSGDTFKWWMQQSDEARSKVIAGKLKSVDVFRNFYDFAVQECDPRHICPWGNGSSFDITILETSFTRVLGNHLHPADRRSPPWRFWNIRDCRTIKDLGEAAGYHFAEQLEGTLHDALDDALFQAKWTSFYWRNLTGPSASSDPDPTENLLG